MTVTPDDMVSGLLDSCLGIAADSVQAAQVRLAVELQRLEYDELAAVLELSREEYAKLRPALQGLHYKMPSLKIIREVDVGMSKEAKEAFISRADDIESFVGLYPKYAVYKTLLAACREEFVRLFKNDRCWTQLFAQYQTDSSYVDEFYAAPQLDLAAMAQVAGGSPCSEPVARLSSTEEVSELHKSGSEIVARAGNAYSRHLENYSLNTVQLCTLALIEASDENILLCAPTSSGKTMAAILAVVHCLAASPAACAYYAAPTKALISEKAAAIAQVLRAGAEDCRVAELSSDVRAGRGVINGARVCVGTPEKLDIILRSGHCFDLIVIDEVHFLDSERGDVLEAIVARTNCRIFAMSATLPNIDDIGVFLRVPECNRLCFGEEHRPQKLRCEYVETALNTASCRSVAARVLSEAKPAIVFVNGRKQAEQMARLLLESTQMHRKTGRTPQARAPQAAPAATKILDTLKTLELLEMATSGICYHHAGMSPLERRAVEELYRLGAVQIIVSTTTLAWGVNLPAVTVVVYGDFSSMEVLQMLGRAGRLAHAEQRSAALGCYYGPGVPAMLNIESELMRGLCFHLNAEIGSGRIQSLSSCFAWFRRTFYYARMQHEAGSRAGGLQTELNTPPSHDDLDSNVRCIIYSAVKELDRSGLVSNFRPTLLGRLSNVLYLRLSELARIQKLNKFYDEALLLELLGDVIEPPTVCIPDISFPIPSDSAVSKTMQLLLAGHDLAIDQLGFLQNAQRILRGVFEYCLARGYAAAFRALSLLHRCAARLLHLRSGAGATADASEHTSKAHSKRQRTTVCAATAQSDATKLHTASYRDGSVVFVSVCYEADRLEHNPELFFVITDSLDFNVLYIQKQRVNGQYCVECYLVDAPDRFLNIRVCSVEHPLLVTERTIVLDRPTAPPPVPCWLCTVSLAPLAVDGDSVITVGGECSGRITYSDFNRVMGGDAAVVGDCALCSTYTTECTVEVDALDEMAHPLSVPDTLLGFKQQLGSGRSKVLLLDTHLRHDRADIRNALLLCAQNSIDTSCCEFDYADVARKTSFCIRDPTLAENVYELFEEDLFSSIAADARLDRQLVLLPSLAIARKLHGRFCSKFPELKGVAAISNPHGGDGRIIFGTNIPLAMRCQRTHLVAAQCDYARITEAAKLTDKLVVYTGTYAYMSLRGRIRLEHAYRKAHLCFGGVNGADTAAVSIRDYASSHILKGVREFELNDTGMHDTEHRSLIQLMWKYSMSQPAFAELLAICRDGIGIKALFRQALNSYSRHILNTGGGNEQWVLYFDALADSAQPIMPCGNLNSTRVDGSSRAGPCNAQVKAGQEVVDYVESYLRCAIELCHLKRAYKALLVAIYALQRIRAVGHDFYTIERIDTPRQHPAPSSSASISTDRQDENKENCARPPQRQGGCDRTFEDEQKISDSSNGVYFVISVTEMVGRSCFFYLVDEEFRFEMLKVYAKGRYKIAWPGALYVLSDCSRGAKSVGENLNVNK
ncbi:pre-mRNA-splicing helicase BRR2 [Pancytospora philotis]|nr:pre-mRNA-splicing helicase BRR2 [Pancytospora philotis]